MEPYVGSRGHRSGGPRGGAGDAGQPRTAVPTLGTHVCKRSTNPASRSAVHTRVRGSHVVPIPAPPLPQAGSWGGGMRSWKKIGVETPELNGGFVLRCSSGAPAQPPPPPIPPRPGGWGGAQWRRAAVRNAARNSAKPGDAVRNRGAAGRRATSQRCATSRGAVPSRNVSQRHTKPRGARGRAEDVGVRAAFVPSSVSACPRGTARPCSFSVSSPSVPVSHRTSPASVSHRRDTPWLRRPRVPKSLFHTVHPPSVSPHPRPRPPRVPFLSVSHPVSPRPRVTATQSLCPSITPSPFPGPVPVPPLPIPMCPRVSPRPFVPVCPRPPVRTSPCPYVPHPHVLMPPPPALPPAPSLSPPPHVPISPPPLPLPSPPRGGSLRGSAVAGPCPVGAAAAAGPSRAAWLRWALGTMYDCVEALAVPRRLHDVTNRGACALRKAGCGPGCGPRYGPRCGALPCVWPGAAPHGAYRAESGGAERDERAALRGSALRGWGRRFESREEGAGRGGRAEGVRLCGAGAVRGRGCAGSELCEAGAVRGRSFGAGSEMRGVGAVRGRGCVGSGFWCRVEAVRDRSCAGSGLYRVGAVRGLGFGAAGSRPGRCGSR